ncbi:hypothetical protein GCM10009663_57220 [Kitasatospora arboriphila]|uniref:Uncharacterized protein n=1 Tax=Kitasatospora arboriphila TaxID=258052 RepID=A0ABP4EJE5_9ACTN
MAGANTLSNLIFVITRSTFRWTPPPPFTFPPVIPPGNSRSACDASPACLPKWLNALPPHPQPVRRGQGYTLRVTTAPAVHLQPTVRPRGLSEPWAYWSPPAPPAPDP